MGLMVVPRGVKGNDAVAARPPLNGLLKNDLLAQDQDLKLAVGGKARKNGLGRGKWRG